jgi:uroporphyrinogen-III synthase
MSLAIKQQPLLERRVLVTRPANQSATLCELIAQAGGIPVRLPALEIVAPESPEHARRQLQRLPECEMGIFISRNAVDKTIELLHPQPLPASVKWLAIGGATAAALKERGYPIALMPEHDFSSEGLLMLPALQQVAGKRIAIIRGAGGRELLADVLRSRGALVEYIETYRSICPKTAMGDLRGLLAQTPPALAIGIVIATSTLILQNLLEMSGNYRKRLIERPLVVLSPRARDWAAAQGFNRIYIAAQSDDPGIVEALIQAASEGL